eukprot:gnl/TRDRNA2_/TRDRNA2_54781_c0_seq1.p1 gnl/TRDRNA2_/TRDRNA2_54781_c0~~gnl/TRDRNA2_/TRDRNA2_54781_c0_seq1.p1  ORF type:complete len:497 (-),score=96.64 gnl/TRDRNA2_/TRDRNA2_54781_c0_seq1:54-1544(-)
MRLTATSIGDESDGSTPSTDPEMPSLVPAAAAFAPPPRSSCGPTSEVEATRSTASSGSARSRALARVAARAAASEAALSAAAAATGALALPAPTGASDEVPLAPCGTGKSSVDSSFAGSLQLSVGVRTQDDVCEMILLRGVKLPARAVKIFTTTKDDQASASIEVYVGERPFCAGNRFLTRLRLAPLPATSYRSFVQLEVTVEAFEDGSLTCAAEEVEGRVLGEPHAIAEWRGSLVEATSSPSGNDGGGEIAVFSHALVKHLPVMLAIRTVRLPCGRDVVIRQHQRREEEKVGTGGVLWEAAIVLADYVGRQSAALAWRGKRVLELGAGTGLVAIALGLEGAQVCATDGNPKVVEGALRNVETAKPLTGSVRLEVFDWNSLDDLKRIQEAGPWDAIVGSDLVYPGNAGRKCVASNFSCPPADETVLSLLSKLAGPDTEVILALKDRTGEVASFVNLLSSEAARDEWQLRRAPPEDLMPEFRNMPVLAVLHLRKRRK